jgi:hypothetical protein
VVQKGEFATTGKETEEAKETDRYGPWTDCIQIELGELKGVALATVETKWGVAELRNKARSTQRRVPAKLESPLAPEDNSITAAET